MLRELMDRLIAFAVGSLYWLLSRTWRTHCEGTPHHNEIKGPRIYAHWHGDELLLIGAHAFQKMVVLSSRSRDGSRLAHLLRFLGYRVVRGSSSRAGAGGLKGLIDAVDEFQCDASLAVDGPRGPIFEVKMGVVKLAQLSRRPLMPGVASARSKYIFEKAWNKCFLPYPFSRCVVLYGDPINVPRGISDEELEEIRLKLQRALENLKAKADDRVAAFVPTPVRAFDT